MQIYARVYVFAYVFADTFVYVTYTPIYIRKIVSRAIYVKKLLHYPPLHFVIVIAITRRISSSFGEALYSTILLVYIHNDVRAIVARIFCEMYYRRGKCRFIVALLLRQISKRIR